LSSVRSIRTAFGAIAGVVANVAGLGAATEPGAVGNAITAVYIFCCIPFGLAALLMFRFVHIVFGKRRGAPAQHERRPSRSVVLQNGRHPLADSPSASIVSVSS
jgi:hypothetical protein